MTTTVKKFHLTWAEVDQKIDQLARNIQMFHDWDIQRVVSIANGGTYIGKRVAAVLDLPHESVRISRYDGERKRETPIVAGKLTQPTGNLIIDDLIDEGGTLDLFDKHFGLAGNKVAVLYHSPGYPKAHYLELKPMAWIIFPWERVKVA